MAGRQDEGGRAAVSWLSSPWVSLLSSLLAFFIPWAVVCWFGDPIATFSELMGAPATLTWMASLSLGFAVMPHIWLGYLRSHQDLRGLLGDQASRWARAAVSVFLVVAFLLPVGLSAWLIPAAFAGENARLETKAMLGLLLALTAVGFVVPVALTYAESALAVSDERAPATGESLGRYEAARGAAQRTLNWMALGLSLFVIVLAAWRTVLLSPTAEGDPPADWAAKMTGGSTAEEYPNVLLIAAAAYYTALAALAYSLAKIPIKRLGERILNNVTPSPNLEGDWKCQWAARQTVAQILDIEDSAMRYLISALAIIAPLISAVLTALPAASRG